MGASRGTDPIIESGNKYGKTDVSHRMNGELLMHECKASERVKALTAADRARMVEILEVVLLNPNPNPLALSLTLTTTLTPTLTLTLALTLALTLPLTLTRSCCSTTSCATGTRCTRASSTPRSSAT